MNIIFLTRLDNLLRKNTVILRLPLQWKKFLWSWRGVFAVDKTGFYLNDCGKLKPQEGPKIRSTENLILSEQALSISLTIPEGQGAFLFFGRHSVFFFLSRSFSGSICSCW